MTLEIRLSGKNAIDSIHGVKGALQSIIRHCGKYSHARLTVNKQRRIIRVQNVDKDFVEESLRKIKSSKVAFKGVSYEIIEIHEEIQEEEGDESEEKKLKKWIQIAQREFEKKEEKLRKEEKRLRQELERLERENRELKREINALRALRQETDKKHSELQKSYESVSKMVETLAKGRVRTPGEACFDWIADWVMTGHKLESMVKESIGDVEPYQLRELLSSTEESILERAARELGVELTDVEELSSLAQGKSWEETDFYKQYSEAYKKALEEKRFWERVSSGEIEVPESVAESLTKMIDIEESERIIARYEAEREEFENKAARAKMASSFLIQIQNAGKAKALVKEFKKLKPLPLAIVVGKEEGKWFCETLYPRGEEEGLIEKVLHDVTFGTIRMKCQNAQMRDVDESVCAIWGKVPGRFNSWKEVSRFQEKVQADLLGRLKGSVIKEMSIPWVISKIMRINS